VVRGAAQQRDAGNQVKLGHSSNSAEDIQMVWTHGGDRSDSVPRAQSNAFPVSTRAFDRVLHFIVVLPSSVSGNQGFGGPMLGFAIALGLSLIGLLWWQGIFVR